MKNAIARSTSLATAALATAALYVVLGTGIFMSAQHGVSSTESAMIQQALQQHS